MVVFKSFSGIITMIDDFWTGDAGDAGCNKLMSVQNWDGEVVNFVVNPTTYFVDHVMLCPGDMVTGFYRKRASLYRKPRQPASDCCLRSHHPEYPRPNQS